MVGEYRVESKVGRGGFGDVFKAIHPLIGKQVAIKVLARRFSVDPEILARFTDEARAVNQIRHRNIIDIFSFGQLPDGRAFYVMEFLQGETLAARLDRDGRMPVGVAVPILRAIGRALDAAHARGIAHRDLKPENVFLASDGDGSVYPKLLDFGIAKLLRRDDETKSTTRMGVPIGTPQYMSPEQCRGKDVDHRTDFYAFGVVAYQLITGVLPIDGADRMTILMKQVDEQPAPASSVCEVPPGVDDVLAWLMRKDPADRPPTLAAAVKALEVAAGLAPLRTPPSGIPVQAPPPPSSPPAADPMPGSDRRVRPARSAAQLGVFVGAIAIALGVVTWLLLANDDAPVVMVATPPSAPPPSASQDLAPVVPDATLVSAEVTIRIVGAPQGTKIHDGSGSNYAPPAFRLRRGDAGVVLTFDAPGYHRLTRTITPSADTTVEVELEHLQPIVAPRQERPQDSSNGRGTIEPPDFNRR
jgi:serine/threonine protein kinase